jgi:hypothetical protein
MGTTKERKNPECGADSTSASTGALARASILGLQRHRFFSRFLSTRLGSLFAGKCPTFAGVEIFFSFFF